MVNQYLILVAQGELAIAHCLGDGQLWLRAMKKMRDATGTPWYRKK